MKVKNIFWGMVAVSLFWGWSNCWAQGSEDGRYAARSEWFKEYDVKCYTLDLDVDCRHANISGYGEVLSEIKQSNLKALRLMLAEAARVDSVFVNGTKANYTRSGKFIDTELSGVKQGDLCKVRIYYAASGSEGDNNLLSGLTHGKDSVWQTEATWTVSEPYQAHTWFPCKEDIQDKADSVYVTLNVERPQVGVSQGSLYNVGIRSDGMIRYQWKSLYPTAYYLISLAVGDYKEVLDYVQPEVDRREIHVLNYLYNTPEFIEYASGKLEQFPYIARIMRSLYGDYPFVGEKYGQVICPLGGGMENQTVSTLGSFDPQLMAHEMAHQWWGNMVGPSSFQDIWLNEGFATYSEYLLMEFSDNKEAAKLFLKETLLMATMQKGGSVFVKKEDLEDAQVIFDYPIRYRRGAMLVHMLRQRVNNDELFFSVLRSYLQKYKYGTASVAEFRAHVEEKTGINLQSFFDEFYYGEGYPVFKVNYEQQDSTCLLTINQSGSVAATPSYNGGLELLLQYEDNTTEEIRVEITGEKTEVSHQPKDGGKKISSVVVNPNSNLLCIQSEAIAETEAKEVITEPAPKTDEPVEDRKNKHNKKG